MEELKPEVNNTENIALKNEQINPVPAPVSVTEEAIFADINSTAADIEKQKVKIMDTTEKVNLIRHNLGVTGEETNFPSNEFSKQNIDKLEKRKLELENKLQEILQYNVAEKYAEVINEVKQSKIDWAHSEELARRLKLKGATEEDVAQVKNWLVDNITNAKTIILPPNKFKEVIEVLHEMTGEDNIKEGEAFHVPGGRDDVPEDVKSAIFLQEHPAKPPLPGQIDIPTKTINTNNLHHEFGHVAQDGLLGSELYQDWNPNFKDTAPDKEYVGSINETDARIQSMYRNINDAFDPQKEVFGKKQLEMLREKLSKGQVNEDTKDLLDHYDDATLIKLANRMPAI